MTNPVQWPISLPQVPLLQGNGLSYANNRLEFEPDVGPVMSRRRSTFRADELTWNFRLTAAQLHIWNLFFSNDTEDGTIPVSMFDFTKNEISNFTIQDASHAMIAGSGLYNLSLTLKRWL